MNDDKILKECIDQHTEKLQLRYLLYITIFTAVVTAIALYLSPDYFADVDDKDGLYRYIVISVPRALMAMTVLLSSSVLVDFIVAGDLLKKIAEESIASAIYAGLVILGVAIAM